MKRAESDFIRQVLQHIRQGLILGKPMSSGTQVLTRLEEAFSEILDGSDVDQVLGIKRIPGAPADPFLDAVAWAIHGERTASPPVKWEDIAEHAEDAFIQNGREPVSTPRLKKIYKDKLPEIRRIESIRRMIEGVNSAIKK